jgi:hypothetical protein
MDMKKQLVGALVALSLVGVSVAASAADDGLHAEGDFGLVVELGIEAGGDEIANVQYDDGSDQSVDTGQGFNIALGMHYRPAGWDVDFSGTLGYKVSTTSASNAAIQIDRTVLQLLATYDPYDTWWMAAGPVWHNDVKFDADGFGQNLALGNATGFTLQAGWKWIGLTYTKMEYVEETTGYNIKLNADAVGLTLRWRG